CTGPTANTGSPTPTTRSVDTAAVRIVLVTFMTDLLDEPRRCRSRAVAGSTTRRRQSAAAARRRTRAAPPLLRQPTDSPDNRFPTPAPGRRRRQGHRAAAGPGADGSRG